MAIGTPGLRHGAVAAWIVAAALSAWLQAAQAQPSGGTHRAPPGPATSANQVQAPATSSGDTASDAQQNKILKQLLDAESGRAPVVPDAPGQAPGRRGEGAADDAKSSVETGRDIAASAKELARPIYNELNSSGLLDAARSVGLIGSGPEKAPNAVNKPAGARNGENPAGSADRGANEPVRSAAENEQLATVLVENFFEEVKPWAIGLAGLWALAYIAKLFWSRRTVRHGGSRRRRSRETRPLAVSDSGAIASSARDLGYSRSGDGSSGGGSGRSRSGGSGSDGSGRRRRRRSSSR